jgi:hypothetical protein
MARRKVFRGRPGCPYGTKALSFSVFRMSNSLPPSDDRPRSRFHLVVSNVEATANDLTASEGQWWPFGFLRPEPDERYSTWRVAALAVLQGLPAGLFLILVSTAARHGASPSRLALFLVTVCTVLFSINRVTWAYFWNRRAERLAKLRERRERWKNGG